MHPIKDFPLLVFVFSLLVLWLSANLGAFFCQKIRPLREEEREDFGVVRGTTLTLLGLLIGFTFSMAISRYDQRKDDEAREANAIGTEYSRADLLPAAAAARVRGLMREYLDQRISFYETRDERELERVSASTTQLQTELWTAVRNPTDARPTALTGLVVSGMNDMLNSQEYAEAAWLNRIPVEAWCLLALIAVGSNLLIGYGAREKNRLLFLVLPLAVSISFFLVADIDSPRRGLISVEPQNLLSLSHVMHGQ
jgi:hypothetical protein